MQLFLLLVFVFPSVTWGKKKGEKERWASTQRTFFNIYIWEKKRGGEQRDLLTSIRSGSERKRRGIREKHILIIFITDRKGGRRGPSSLSCICGEGTGGEGTTEHLQPVRSNSELRMERGGETKR